VCVPDKPHVGDVPLEPKRLDDLAEPRPEPARLLLCDVELTACVAAQPSDGDDGDDDDGDDEDEYMRGRKNAVVCRGGDDCAPKNL
jgi:hypothetical protein